MSIAIDLSVSVVSMMLGIFAVVSPARAARTWASGRFERLTPRDQAWFLRWYRAFGVILCLGSVMFALDSIGFWR